jgi:hypothetical protein
MGENLKFSAQCLLLPGRYDSAKLNRAIKQEKLLSGAVNGPTRVIRCGVKSECAS